MSKEKNWKGAVKYLKVAAAGTLLASIGSAYTFESASAAENTGTDVQVTQMFEQSKVLSGMKFKDVNADYWAYDSVKWAYEKGIISGYDDGTFKPGGLLTEAQFVAILTRYYEDLASEVSTVKYTGNHWADANYEVLAQHKVPLLGYTNSVYKNTPVMRGLIAQVISHLNGSENDLESSINYLFKEGISVGKTSQGNIYDRFGHKDNLTRAHAVVFFHRLFQQGKTNVDSVVASNKVTINLDAVKKQAVSTVDKTVVPVTKVAGVSKGPVAKKVMWGKTELVKGQIGKVTILANTPLVKIVNGKLVTVRTLKKGEEYRVYQAKSDHGGLYGVGGSSFVQKNTKKVKYETPSKAKLDQVNGKPSAPTIVIKPTNPVPAKPTTPVTPKPSEPVSDSAALKVLNSTFGSSYENKTVKGGVASYKKGELIFSYNTFEGTNTAAVWDLSTQSLAYKAMKQLGLPLTEAEFNSAVKTSAQKGEAVQTKKVYIFNSGSNITVSW